MKQLESLVLQYLFTPNRYRTLTLLAVKHPDTNWSAFPEATSIVCCVPHELRHGSLLFQYLFTPNQIGRAHV